MTEEMNAVLSERFSKDSLIALATCEGGVPSVRTVNAYYSDGKFYVITHLQSGKMKQIENNPLVGLCGEWFTGHGAAKSLGWITDEKNLALKALLCRAFSAWLGNGHTDLNDRNTVILEIALTDGVLLRHGERFAF